MEEKCTKRNKTKYSVDTNDRCFPWKIYKLEPFGEVYVGPPGQLSRWTFLSKITNKKSYRQKIKRKKVFCFNMYKTRFRGGGGGGGGLSCVVLEPLASH